MSSSENNHGALNFADRLRLAKDAKGWTVTEMSEKIGIPRRSLDNYMKKDDPQSPGMEALVAIAEGLNVSLDWLLRGEDGLNTIRSSISRQAWESLKHHELKSIKFVNSSDNPQEWTSNEIAAMIATEISERSVLSISKHGNLILREKQYRDHPVERIVARDSVPFDFE